MASEEMSEAQPAEPARFTPELRLHPWSWLFAVIALLKQLIVPLIAVVVVGADNDRVLFGFWLLLPIFVAAIWRQAIYRYGFGPNGLVIHEGLAFRSVRQIDYARIENIDTERGPLHRMLGVAQVRVETSTGGRPEALIRVVSLDAVDAMREHVFAEAARARDADITETEAAPSERPLLHLPPGELVRYGLIDNRGMIIVAAAAGVMQQSGVFRASSERFEQWLDVFDWQQLAELGLVVQAVLALGTVVGLLAAVRVLSVLFALVNFHDFTLTQRNGDLRVRYGLLTRVAATLRLPRIQAVHRTETLLHRWFGRVSLRVDMAGGAGQGDAAEERERWLAPICTPDTAQMLTRAALPAAAPHAEPDWQRLAPRARTRLFRRTLRIWILLLAAPAIWFSGYWAPLWLVPLVIVSWLHARLYVKHTRWALTPDAVCFKQGWLTRRHVIAPRNRVQSVVVTESPFDRRYRMAAIAVDTAGTSRGRHLHIPYLDTGDAHHVRHQLARLHAPPWGQIL